MMPAGEHLAPTLASWRMRFVGAVVAVVALSACPGPTSGGECFVDAECGGGDVCARDSTCASPGSLTSVTTTWTIRGGAASATTCATTPDLVVEFIGRDLSDTLAYSPVPCELGRFFIDKLPSRFAQVGLSVEGSAARQTRTVIGGMAAFDL